MGSESNLQFVVGYLFIPPPSAHDYLAITAIPGNSVLEQAIVRKDPARQAPALLNNRHEWVYTQPCRNTEDGHPGSDGAGWDLVLVLRRMLCGIDSA